MVSLRDLGIAKTSLLAIVTLSGVEGEVVRKPFGRPAARYAQGDKSHVITSLLAIVTLSGAEGSAGMSGRAAERPKGLPTLRRPAIFTSQTPFLIKQISRIAILAFLFFGFGSVGDVLF